MACSTEGRSGALSFEALRGEEVPGLLLAAAPLSAPAEGLLDSFDAAWMGGSGSGVGALPTAKSTSTTSSRGPIHPLLLPSARGPPAASAHALRLPIRGDAPSSDHHHAHGEVSGVPCHASTSSPSKTPKRPHDGDGEGARTGAAPAHHTNGHVAMQPASLQPVMPAASAPVHAPQTSQQQPKGDYKASVFFSPIPLSCLSIARSNSSLTSLDSHSHSHLLDGSPAAGDVTLRGGRLAHAASTDWGVEDRAGRDADGGAVGPRGEGLGILALLPHVLDHEAAPTGLGKRQARSQSPRSPDSPDSVMHTSADASGDDTSTVTDTATSGSAAANICGAGEEDSEATMAAQERQQAEEQEQQQQQQQQQRSEEAQRRREEAEQQQQQQQQEQQFRPAVPDVPATPVRSSDTPSASAQPASSERTRPLAPAGLHPILSRPPASASASPSATVPPSPCVSAFASPSPSACPLFVPEPTPLLPPSLLVPLPAMPVAMDALLSPHQSDHPLHGGGLSIAAAARGTGAASRPSSRLIAGTAMIPHIDKVDKGGEDAFCVVLHGLGAIGVADGVSGWAEEGVDPAAYSRMLMQHTSTALSAGTLPAGADPREAIRYAHQNTVMAGSSTICVAVMKPQGRMVVANLGDSGVRLIRDGKIVFASTAQQHMFNMPYQLSHPSIIESPDDADSADVTTLDVQPGDLVVLATDGLFDNVFDEEIAHIARQALPRRANGNNGSGGSHAPGSHHGYTASDAEVVANAIARTAHRYALDPHQRTPWSVAASETGMPWARFFAKGGGKMDDVTVVVALVVEEQQ